MDNVIRFLGENYHWISTFGYLLVLCLITLWLASIFLAWKKSLLRITVFTFSLVVILVMFVLVKYVNMKVKDLLVPNDYMLQAVTVNANKKSLNGDFLYPRGKTNLPAVVFVVGSSVSSYRTNYSRLANEVLIPIFSDLGFAILFFDKPGVGKSSGDWKCESFQDRADDVYSAIEFLKRNEQIDENNIGVIGHSQGGWIAQLVASQHDDINFMISLAGGAVGVKEQIIQDEMGGSICNGMDTINARAKASSLIKELELRSLNARKGIYKQYALIKDYTPDSALVHLTCNSLLLFGANDRLVWSKRNVDKLYEIFGGELPENITMEVIPNVGHSFRNAELCPSGSGKSHYSKKFMLKLKQWLLESRQGY